MTLGAVLMDALVEHGDGELAEVWRRRFHEARLAGLSIADSSTFADSQEDIGLLRKLVTDGATPKQIARIVL